VLDHLLQGVVEDPQAEARWQILADWLEEHDEPGRAELLRLHRRLLATCCAPQEHPERTVWQAQIVALLTEGMRPCVPQRTVVLGKGVEMTFSFIPPGTFLMGSPFTEEGRRNDAEALHRVELTQGFWMGVHPLTQAQWIAARGEGAGDADSADHPVKGITWDECLAFSERLAEMTGSQFRLPTEAEWEWACREGSSTAYHTGDGLEAMKRAGWCNHDGTWGTGVNSLPGYLDWGRGAGPKPVGQFVPNAWGLYDMHGNVWEWCSDWYDPRPQVGERVDPVGPARGTKRVPRERVLRGGSYWNDPSQCRSASRCGHEPDIPADTVGCRLVLCPD
jgi:uncharacterized protein (TIGR02996 family)